LRSFPDAERLTAEQSRLDLDLLNSSGESEIVLLEAESEEKLRRTHRRYFESVSDLLTHTSREVAAKD
jgi:hypothetical protein